LKKTHLEVLDPRGGFKNQACGYKIQNNGPDGETEEISGVVGRKDGCWGVIGGQEKKNFGKRYKGQGASLKETKR